MGFFFTVLGVLPLTIVVGELVSEKELRIREGARMMGLKAWVISATWLTTYAVMFVITALLMALATGWSVYKHSIPVIIFAMFYLFYISLYAFAFFMSSFFSRAQTAAAFSAIIFIASLFLGDLATNADSRGAKLLGALAPPVALSMGSQTASRLESAGVGVTRGTFTSQIDLFSVADSLLMMFIASVILMLLGVYLQEVLPNEYGTPRKWYFFLKPSFWCGSGSGNDRVAVAPAADPVVRPHSLNDAVGHVSLSGSRGGGADAADDGTGSVLTIFDNEPYSKIEPPDMVLAGRELVRLRGLRKTFPQVNAAGETVQFAAVNALSLDMYEGQIFTLLGHNGAGKSTTFNMLTGLFPMTSGKVTVLGRDLAAEMDQIRKHMGVCPQHDILYSHLSVREHLELYAAIKGVSQLDIPAVAQSMLDDVGLGIAGDNKADALAGTLSGGQKRKLSVGIAQIGRAHV